MRLDHETLMAALLHDVIEDTPATFQDIEELFGTTVAGLVEGVSKLDKLNFRDKRSPSRKLPQNDHGDGKRYPCHFDKTGRPHSQHAHVSHLGPINVGALHVKPLKYIAR